MNARPTRTLLPILMGLVLPVVVLAAGYTAVRHRSDDLSADAVEFEARLEVGAPQVVVLGSSLVNRGIDLPTLARDLDLPEDDVVMLQLPHSSTAHWYAITKNRVFANGHRPRLVLVVGALTTMLNHDLLTLQPNVERLVGQLSDDEPVIASKVLRVSDPLAFRVQFLRERASRLRQELLDGWRTWIVTQLFARRGWEEGRRLVEKVNEEVFSNDRMDYSLHRQQTTGLAASVEVPSTEAGDFELRRDALVGDFQDSVAAHGASLVYVRYPFPPSNRAMDEVPLPVERDALDWMDEVGSGYLDMRLLDSDDSFYEDMRHMTREGALRFTSAVARALTDMGALTDGHGVGVVRGLGPPTAVTRAGDGPTLPALDRAIDCTAVAPAEALAAFAGGEGPPRAPVEVVDGDRVLDPAADGTGCVGGWRLSDGRIEVHPLHAGSDALSVRRPPLPEGTGVTDPAPVWIAPGEQLELTFDTPWRGAPDALLALVRAQAVGGAGALRLASGAWSQELAVEGDRVTGVVALPVQEAPWSLTLHAPADGPWFRLHHLALGAPPATTYVFGTAETLHGASVRLVGGRADDVRSKPTWAEPPVSFPAQPRLRDGVRQMGTFDSTAYAELADAPTNSFARPNRCTPVEVLEDGEALPLPHATCYDVMTKGAGRSCFAGETMYFSASDDTDPVVNGRRYTVRLDPRRTCETFSQRKATTLRDSYWLYPGDVMTLAAPPKRVQSFYDGANELELEVLAFVDTPSQALTVRVEVAGKPWTELAWLPPPGSGRKSVHLPIDPPLPPEPDGVTLVLSNPNKAFLLVTKLALSEGDEALDLVAAPTGDRRPLPLLGARREGQPGPAPEVKKVKTTVPGALEARVFALWPVSDTNLAKIGLPAMSPMKLMADGVPLERRTDRSAVRATCSECFAHMGQSFIYQTARGALAELSLGLDMSLPMTRSDGAEVWWVLPGTTVLLDVGEAWSSGAGDVVIEGHAFHPQRDRAGQGVRARVGEVEAEARRVGQGSDTTVRVRVSLEAPPAVPWTVAVWSEAGVEMVMVERVWVEADGGVGWVLPRPSFTAPR